MRASTFCGRLTLFNITKQIKTSSELTITQWRNGGQDRPLRGAMGTGRRGGCGGLGAPWGVTSLPPASRGDTPHLAGRGGEVFWRGGF